MHELKRDLQRIDRLVEVRETYVTAAEARVKEAEARLREFEAQAAENARQIQRAREEFAYLGAVSGQFLQNEERYISSLQERARRIRQDIEKSKQLLEARRLEWRETMKDKKIVEKVQERRLHEWQRAIDVQEQKDVDEMSIGRYARNQSNVAPDRSTESRSSTTGPVERIVGNLD